MGPNHCCIKSYLYQLRNQDDIPNNDEVRCYFLGMPRGCSSFYFLMPIIRLLLLHRSIPIMLVHWTILLQLLGRISKRFRFHMRRSKARTAIKDQLMKNKEEFLKQIDAMHALYQSTYERYLKSCAGLSAADLAARVKAYADILKASREQADKNYVAAVNSAIARIELFHAQILARFRSCITGRDAKLKSYNGQLKCRIESMITRYQNQLKAIASRRHSFVVSTFLKLYAGTAHVNTSTAMMVEYKKKLDKEVEKLVQDFRTKVEAVVKQLEESYRCNYKCYFQIGCRGFSRRSYSRSCVRFPSPPCYSYKLTGLCAFNADWNGCAYNCLRTCPAEQKVCVFDHDKYVKEVDAKKVQYEADLDKKVIEWTKQIEEWKKSAMASLKSKISC